MKPFHLLLTGLLLGHALAGDGYSSPSPTHKRFSVLERRAREIRESTAVVKRNDFTCGPGKPCENGACCGKDGWCGYGPTYCGTGCTSNCDAHAECGRDAVPVNKTCPLNTCCSEFGFCGTTKDFCTGKCQSNCVEHPKPLGRGKGGKTLSKIIGYYEAWNDRSLCHQTTANDLPVNGLTHLNYAFAFIDPTTFKLTTIDAATPVHTFKDVAALKLKNPALELFVSIGGWTFSDNGTATQPVFGNIARSPANRQTFANNVLKFLNTYGYDGVDIDWEYPGAPDRGGKPEDTKNYVLMLETLRKTFHDSGRKLGITFTAPSSFWYLRWFDLTGMVKYVDWINIMTYDLHGVWDSSNPIGPIVQAHTNLTEIKLATELFWRAGIPPSKLALGFGFYGRAFTLKDPTCNKPGCPFTSGAKPGVCTGTSGYLAHYEIQDIIAKSKKRDLITVHDKEAAVKYMAWDNDQWVSFDDSETFKNKIKWADDIGFTGSLIWASDLDDYELSAHKALSGNPEFSMENPDFGAMPEIDASFGHNCYKGGSQFDDRCDPGFGRVGLDRDGVDCSGIHESQCGRPICCPETSGMTGCMWRGSGGDCNGQCHEGEVKIAASSWGGTPGESSPTKKCNRGDKALCCKANSYTSLTEGCRWTGGCSGECNSDEESVAYARDRWGLSTVFCNGNHYCCKKDRPIPFRNCHWVGEGDCADNTCAKSEVTLWTNDQGDSYSACSWWRNKALCCTPNAAALNEDICDYDACADDPDLCDEDLEDDLDDDLDDDLRDDFEDDLEDYLRAANWTGIGDGLEYGSEDLAEELTGKPRSLYPGGPRQYVLEMAKRKLVWYSRPYPTGNKHKYLFRPGTGLATMLLKGSYGKASEVCTNSGLAFTRMADMAKKGFQTEHLLELQLPNLLLRTAYTGKLPKVAKTAATQFIKAARITEENLYTGWHKLYPDNIKLNQFYEVVNWKGLPKDYLPPPNTPCGRMMTLMGDWGNMQNLAVTTGDINLMKGTLFRLYNPIGAKSFEEWFGGGMQSDVESIRKIETKLKNVFLVFAYLNDVGLEPVWRQAYQGFNQEVINMDLHMPELKGIKAIWDELWPVYQQVVAERAANWVLDLYNMIDNSVSAEMAASGGPLAKLVQTTKHYAEIRDHLRWSKDVGK